MTLHQLVTELKSHHNKSHIYYEVTGSGEPLILIHGLCASRRWWRKNVPILARHFRVYTLDLIGFGNSQAKEGFVLDVAAQAVHDWMVDRGIPRARVIGHSMGGRIAAELAVDYPETVEQLILVDAPLFPFNHSLLRQGWGMLYSLRYTPLDLLRVVIADTLQLGLWPTIKIGLQIMASDLTEKLAQLHIPTLIIWGDQDTIVPLRLGEALADVLVPQQFVVLPGVGHTPMWERPEQFNELALTFLKEAPLDKLN